jgi:hypothetical protein
MLSCTFKKPVPGKGWCPKTGKLFIYRTDRIEVLKVWPDIRAWRKTQQNPVWRGARPTIKIPKGNLREKIEKMRHSLEQASPLITFFDAVSPDITRYRNLIRYYEWADAIPSDIREIVNQFSSRHWQLLSVLARCGEPARNLAIANPALLYMLASSWVFKKTPVKQPLRSVRAMLRRKQRDILPWLGFPGTNRMRNILRKIPLNCITIPNLLILQSLANRSDSKSILKKLSYLTRINTGVLEILNNDQLSSLVSDDLLHNIGLMRSEDNFVTLGEEWLRQVEKMQRFLACTDRPVPIITKYNKAGDYLNNLMRKVIRYSTQNRVEFGTPPVPGNLTIEPISDTFQLDAQAQRRNNCLRQFVLKILTDKLYYAYRIPEADDVTITLTNHGSAWGLHQFEFKDTDRMLRTTFLKILSWLDEHEILLTDQQRESLEAAKEGTGEYISVSFSTDFNFYDLFNHEYDLAEIDIDAPF